MSALWPPYLRDCRFLCVDQDTARFPHNLITAKKPTRKDPASSLPAPDVADEAAFPDIGFAAGVAGRQQRGPAASKAGASSAADSGGGGGAGFTGEVEGGRGGTGGWDGQGNIEEAQVVSGR